MASPQAYLLSFLLRHTFKQKLARAKDVLEARAVLNRGMFHVPPDVRITPATLAGIPGEWVDTGAGGPVLLFLHGGGYFACSARTHRPYSTAFAQAGFRVFAPNYRLAPEHPFPAAVLDAVAVYRALREQEDPSAPILIAGDSAGGGLALAAMLLLRDEGDPLPAAAALFSPLTDLTGAGDSRTRNDKRCAMFYAHTLPRAADFYLAGSDPRHPLASPVYADLQGLPPLMIHVGADETLLDDSVRLADGARAAGVSVDLKIWPAVPHDWPLFHTFLPEGRRSLAEVSAFLRQVAGHYDVLIVGGGFAGICMGIQLRKAGLEAFAILERAERAGGTWRDNTYPGCACDIASHLYSFSFEPNPNWTRMYPPQKEIWDYLEHCIDKYGLRPHIRLGSDVREARFDEEAHLWRLRTAQGSELTARSVVFAMGPLNRPAYPQIPGLPQFEGLTFHSSHWDHDYDLTGKRVAVIGTGASSIQFVPQIAPKVSQLYLFQRTPPWILPKPDRPIRGWERLLLRWLPGVRWLFREFIYWRLEIAALGFTKNPKWMGRIEKLARAHMERSIPDPDLRARVTPRYTIGCKRVLISNDYYPALTRPNVELVTEAITEVRDGCIVTAAGRERPVDAIIYGTGFRATDMLTPVRIVGRQGRELNEDWRNGAEAYFGITVAGYPNLYFLVGPNTGLGHNSIIFMIEAQVHYVMECLRLLKARKAMEMDLLPQAQADFNRRLQEDMKRTVWMTGCKSWYLDPSGKNTTLWPGFSFRYRMRTRSVATRDYRFIRP